MANIRFSAAIADARGSVGGVTFTRGKGGAVLRTRIKPTNPRALNQRLAQARLVYVTEQWSGALIAAQRSAWQQYADNTTWTNKLGDVIQLGGLAAYVRLNTVLLRTGEALRQDAPTAYGHAVTPVFTILADGADNGVDMVEPTAGFNRDTDDDWIVTFVHRPQSPGRSGIAPGKQFSVAEEGDSVSPPTFPLALTHAYAIENGQLVTASAVHIDPDFRMSPVGFAQVVAATP